MNMWIAMANIGENPDGTARYALIEANGRYRWKTKRTAEKHAREYKALHLRDAWAEED
jgi:hypothetical protein